MHAHVDSVSAATPGSARTLGFPLALLLAAGCSQDAMQSPDAVDMSTPVPSGPTWRSSPSLPQARTEVSAAVVQEKIYLLGGLAQGGVTNRVDIFDPQTGSWSAGPALPNGAPQHHLAVAVHQDKIYIVGGYEGILFTPTNRTWVLDTTWKEQAQQPIVRGAATAQTLKDKIYVAGGTTNGGTAVATVHAYDPQMNMWTPRADMKTVREHLASCAVAGKMLVAGGRTQAAGNLNVAEWYDPAADRWDTLPSLPTARGGLAAAALGNVCHVFGGERPGAPPNTFNENEGYDAIGGAWKAYPPMPTARHGLAAAALGMSIYVLSGGPQAGFSYSDVVEVFAPSQSGM